MQLGGSAAFFMHLHGPSCMACLRRRAGTLLPAPALIVLRAACGWDDTRALEIQSDSHLPSEFLTQLTLIPNRHP